MTDWGRATTRTDENGVTWVERWSRDGAMIMRQALRNKAASGRAEPAGSEQERNMAAETVGQGTKTHGRDG